MTVRLDEIFRTVKESLDAAMCAGAYSLGFAIDLTMLAAMHLENTHRVIDEVAALENPGQRKSATKPASAFIRPLLKGYWHKHQLKRVYQVGPVARRVVKVWAGVEPRAPPSPSGNRAFMAAWGGAASSAMVSASRS